MDVETAVLCDFDEICTGGEKDKVNMGQQVRLCWQLFEGY